MNHELEFPKKLFININLPAPIKDGARSSFQGEADIIFFHETEEMTGAAGKDVLMVVLTEPGAVKGIDGAPDRLTSYLALGGRDSDPAPDLTYPLRFGVLLKAVRQRFARLEQLAAAPELIAFKSFSFRPGTNVFTGTDGAETRLTEKEREILLALYQAGKEGLDRNTLLSRVWQYVDGVETHTLETHIYRLRQKIERDPSKPEILLTAENGYSLNMTDGKERD